MGCNGDWLHELDSGEERREERREEKRDKRDERDERDARDARDESRETREEGARNKRPHRMRWPITREVNGSDWHIRALLALQLHLS